MIFAITENEFDKITGGELMNDAAAIICQSNADTWLKTRGGSVVGVIRCDKDLGETTYSWGVYRRARSTFEFVNFAHDLPYHDDAMTQCMRCMLEVDL